MGVLKKLLSYDTVFTEELLQRIREQYIPTNWVSGEIITATRLNHMEQGIYENSKMAENTVQQDGEYPFLTAGLTENLKSDSYTVNQTPYFVRPVINNSDREIDSVVGGSVGWNQQLDYDDVTINDINGLSGTITNGHCVVSGVSRMASSFSLIPGNIYTKTKPINNHKYLFVYEGNIINAGMYFGIYGSTNQMLSLQDGTRIFNCTAENATDSKFIVTPNNTTDTVSIDFKSALFDITAMFGSTIADYIYTLETATAGAGIAKLKSWGFFAEDYYEYDAGNIKSVEGVSAHITRDADENIIGNYPLDSSVVLRGVPKLSESNDLYYDGDVYSADGTVQRRYGVVDLGNLTWLLNASNEFAASLAGAKGDTYTAIANALCVKYVFDTYNHVHGHNTDKTIAVLSTNSYVYVYDTAYSDVTTFTTAMSGVYLVYELATPTTETTDPFQNPQLVSAGGTEEYVSTGIVPVGHYTQYPENLKAKLESMPNLPTQEGVYVLKYDDGVASYILLETDETVVDMLARIAALEGD